MDIRSGLDGLKSLLGVSPATQTTPQPARSVSASPAGSVSSDSATLSSAGSEVSQTASDGGVRMDKVSGIQAALAAGTYSVPASAVASRMMNVMLAGGQ
jgi:flagellar biosynthesis anti-sigma factor FlgM